jgi:hypothetical protein
MQMLEAAWVWLRPGEDRLRKVDWPYRSIADEVLASRQETA